ncbi:MAG: hypothetical protein IPM38_06415 [Ignavibacteria bacterium]|nr:hypothetical protein [Ignavibacteria bacterium]
MTRKNYHQTAILILLMLISQNCIPENFDADKYKETTFNFPDTNKNNHLSIVDAVNFISEKSHGEIVSAEKKFRKDNPVWEINLITEPGSAVKIEVSYFERSVLSMISDETPFTYDLRPSENFISLTEAIRIVSEHTQQNVMKWKFHKVKDNWEYNFWLFTKSGKAQLRLNAESGEIISSKKKSK